jgi:hypothetical protein
MRKIHNQESGYIAERRNPLLTGAVTLQEKRQLKVTIYRAIEAGIDTGGYKYAVICDAHSQIGGTGSVLRARGMMKDPTLFCTECRQLAEGV